MKKNWVFNLLVIMLLLVALFPAQQAALAQPSVGDQLAPDAQFVPGELVISFAKGSSPAVYTQRANGLAKGMGGTVTHQYENSALLSFTPNASVTALVKRIFSLFPDVIVQPNYVYRLPETDGQAQGSAPLKTGSGISRLTTSELLSLRSGSKIAGSPAFPNEVDTAWGWQKVGGEIIWSQALSTANVCLIDTGVDTAHPEFTGMTLPGYDYVNGDTIPNDDNGHGTHLAGIIIAKANNGAGTAIGIANTKLVPVKAANAQGWGTSFNVSAALTFCAAQKTVKVINLSLVSPNPDALVYGRLKNAITLGKLVVVAAGNDSKSYNISGGKSYPASFPAGWAIANVDVNGVYHATPLIPPDTSANTIYNGLISVAAARDPSLDTWVDTEVGTQDLTRIIQEPEELHADCATELTNYGNWITLVAPGANIYSTTPKTYPFYMNYQLGVPAVYGVMSGTSQAAAFVSGAASRVWGVYATMSAEQVKTRLVESGALLDQVNDLGNRNPINPNLGFNQPSDYSVAYGTPFNRVDENQTPDTVIAPFCWPEGSGAFTDLQDMSDARYLNVASAMNRVAFLVTALDASSGMPLAGATIRALLGPTGTTAVGPIATVPTGLTRAVPDAALINLPLNYDKNTFIPSDTTFRLQVSKTGYTTSYQTFNQIDVDPHLVGTIITDPYNQVSLLPSTLIQAVVDWKAPVDFDYSNEATDPFPNLAAVLFFPPAIGPANSGAIVGPMDIPASLSAYIGKYLYAGTLQDPIKICGSATCTWSPYAQYQHDGGLKLGQDADGNFLFSTTEEAISLTSGGTVTTSPFLKPKYVGNYTLMVTANDVSFLQGGDPAALENPIYPVVRVWAKGNLIGNFKLESADDGSCNGTTNHWWKVATLGSTAPAELKTCGNGPNPFFPFPPAP